MIINGDKFDNLQDTFNDFDCDVRKGGIILGWIGWNVPADFSIFKYISFSSVAVNYSSFIDVYMYPYLK